MHEITILENIFKIIEEKAADEDIRIGKIYLTIGESSGVSIYAIKHAFNCIDKSAKFLSTELIVNKIPLTIYCSDCNSETKITPGKGLICKRCKKATSNITKGLELTIDKVELIHEPQIFTNKKRYPKR